MAKTIIHECRRVCALMTSYVDETLDTGQRADVERHLAACPPCRDRAAQERGGRTLLRGCASRLRGEPLPPGLRSRCEALARERTCVRPQAGWRTLLPMGLAGVLGVFAFLLLLSLATRRSDALLAAQLTADHAKCFAFFADRDAPTADAHAVESDLASKYGWQMHVPPSLPDAELRLIGGRRCVYADGLVPHLMYQVGNKPVSLFRLDGETRKNSDITSLGYHCRIWSRDGHTFVLVAPDRATPELTRIARYVEEQAR
ncbi:MAG TPA: zf-HC2 domain-containing protein [Vicinamibacterales bacterium]|nr:zf-HC2 domain-containing protein [Vicinamibacterales bacterium]